MAELQKNPASGPALPAPINPKIQTVKYAPPPPQLPMLGKIDQALVSFVGQTNYVAALEEKKFVFGIKREDRRRHLYIIGKSGSGKSKFLELLIRQDIASGAGLFLMDPHGEVIDDLLDFVPESRIDDVCLIDPADIGFSVAFNPLAGVEQGFKHQFAHSLIEVVKKQFGVHWSPRLEHLFRFATLALLDYPEATMQHLTQLLTDAELRQKVAAHSSDQMIKRFWATEFPEWSRKFDDAVSSLVTKLGQFLSDPVLRDMFSRKENRIDLAELISKKKIILVDLKQSRLGQENAGFLGALLLIKLKQAGMARTRLEARDRSDFYVYVDEFHHLATEAFESLLADAYKYGMPITVANQYLDQLSPRLQASVLGSIGSLVVFRVAGQDGEKLEAEMAPIFKVKDMINLGRQEFYIKLMIDGENYDPFSARTLKVLKPEHPSYRERIIEGSRKRYAISSGSIKPLVDEKGAI